MGGWNQWLIENMNTGMMFDKYNPSLWPILQRQQFLR
jgi:hypothetical protein